LDHGGITILLSPLYFNLKGEIVEKPKEGGLYVRERNGNTVKINVPEDCLAI